MKNNELTTMESLAPGRTMPDAIVDISKIIREEVREYRRQADMRLLAFVVIVVAAIFGIARVLISIAQA